MPFFFESDHFGCLSKKLFSRYNMKKNGGEEKKKNENANFHILLGASLAKKRCVNCCLDSSTRQLADRSSDEKDVLQ